VTFPQTYQTDGVTAVWSFDFPYLDRSHVFVVVNDAPRSFTFIDDHTLRVVDLFGNPFPKGQPMTIGRATPDTLTFADFKDAANLTADDLNRARLQVLFLVQERSGGMAGAIGTAISNLANEIETISGALDSLAETQGVLQAGLGTLQGLGDRLTVQENGAKALRDMITQEVQNRTDADSALTQRVDSLETSTANSLASFQSDITLLTSQTGVLAGKTDELSARLDNVEAGDGDGQDGDDSDDLAASIINSAIASVKQDSALAQQITTLTATINDDVKAQLQIEQTARVTADEALAEQITSLQAEIGDNIAQVIQDIKTDITAVDGKVTGLQSQWTLKAQVQREDGTVVMGGIGLAATANDDYVGSKLVLMADSILFADPNTPNGDLVSFLEAGLVDGAPTLVVPSARVGDQTLPGRVLVDGSVEARSIAANTITGDKIVAGSIDADRINVGLGVNLLKNSVLLNLTDWGLVFTGGYNSSTCICGVNLDTVNWAIAGGHTAYISCPSSPGGTIATQNSYLVSGPVPVNPGDYYEFSVYCIAWSGCDMDVELYFYDVNGANVAGYGYINDPASYLSANVTTQVGNVLSAYRRLGNIGKAPVNATSARLVVRKGPGPVGTPTWGFFTQPMVARTNASATRLSPYTPSGLGTLITPDGISTPSLSALSATIGLLRTATSGARMEIDNTQLRVYGPANNLKLRLGSW
jgi:hypothetical protein